MTVSLFATIDVEDQSKDYYAYIYGFILNYKLTPAQLSWMWNLSMQTKTTFWTRDINVYFPVQLDTLTWRSVENYLFLEPPSSGHSMNWCFLTYTMTPWFKPTIYASTFYPFVFDCMLVHVLNSLLIYCVVVIFPPLFQASSVWTLWWKLVLIRKLLFISGFERHMAWERSAFTGINTESDRPPSTSAFT